MIHDSTHVHYHYTVTLTTMAPLDEGPYTWPDQNGQGVSSTRNWTVWALIGVSKLFLAENVL